MRENTKQTINILNESKWTQNNNPTQKYRIGCNNIKQFKIQKDNLIKYAINTIVQVPIQHLLDFIQIYQWRERTDYPIVSSKWKQVIFKDRSTSFIHKQQLMKQIQYLYHNNNYPLLQLEVEPVTPLSIYLPLPFTHFLYALKESLVGFQRLLAMFGTFQIVQNMIAVNKEGRVKVWISQHYDQNSKIDIDQAKLYVNEEQYMISKIKDVFLRFAASNAIFRDFFKNLQNISTFLHFFKYIEDFMVSKKVIIGKNILKKSHITNKRPLSPIINLKPVGRTPKFIIAGKRQIPCLGLGFRQSVHKPRQFNFSQLKTKETFINESDEKFRFEEETNASPTKTGKIIKNNLSKIRSLNNLSCERTVFDIQKSSIENSINRLFEQDEHQPSSQKQRNLMEFGRQVSESIIMKQA